MSTRLVRAGDLVVRPEVYPRVGGPDPENVKRLQLRLQRGIQLDPMIVDGRTIIDGAARLQAYLNTYGPTHLVEVIGRRLRTDDARLAAAVAYNEDGPQRLTAADRAHCAVVLGEVHGYDTDRIAVTLRITPQKVVRLTTNIAYVPQESVHLNTRVVVRTRDGGGILPLKRSMSFKAGETLTDDEIEAHRGAPGLSWAALAQQLVKGLRHPAAGIDPDDLELRASLGELRDALNLYLARTTESITVLS